MTPEEKDKAIIEMLSARASGLQLQKNYGTESDPDWRVKSTAPNHDDVQKWRIKPPVIPVWCVTMPDGRQEWTRDQELALAWVRTYRERVFRVDWPQSPFSR